MTHLNDISKVYMEKVAKPDFLDLDKDGNKKEPMKKAAVEAPKERLKTDRDGYRVPKKDADAARERLLAKARAKRAKMSEALDPVGKEDADVDNDGKKNTKSDKYLLNRRKAIGKAMKEAKNIHGEIENPSTDLKGNVKKAVKRIDTNVSGDVNKKDKSMGDYGEFVPTPDGKKVTTSFKEGYSNWRNDLREVMGEDGEEKKQVKEKNVKNTIKINPKISEEVVILESIEMNEVDFEEAVAKKIEETAMQMSPAEVALQKKKATVDQQIAMKRKQALTKIKKQPEQEVNKEEFALDERTRYAKETGKDYTTGNPSEKGGTMKGSAMAKVGAELRKTGGMMSSRKKAIQPQGKKKEKGAKPKFKTAPTPVDKIKAKLAQKRAPKKDPYGYGQGRYQGD